LFMDDAHAFHLSITGRCPVCEVTTTFEANDAWLRDALLCANCGSIPRERAVALVLDEVCPYWRTQAIHESSPSDRGISKKLRDECRNYVASNYFDTEPLGSIVRGLRNENLEKQTFADESFDIVVTLDVFEHLFDPAAALKEIHRTLKVGGVAICAFPMIKMMADAVRWRAKRNSDGSVEYLLPAEYHGNPISEEGSLVTVDYGYDIHQQFAEWAPLDVRLQRFANASAGILGEFTDVAVCRKR